MPLIQALLAAAAAAAIVWFPKQGDCVALPQPGGGASVWDVPLDRHRRSANPAISGRTRSCDILMAIDDVLWEQRERNMTDLVETAHHLVDQLNNIFVKQIFSGPYDYLYFRLARVQV